MDITAEHTYLLNDSLMMKLLKPDCHNAANFSKHWKGMIGFAEDEFKDSLEEFENRLNPEDRERFM